MLSKSCAMVIACAVTGCGSTAVSDGPGSPDAATNPDAGTNPLPSPATCPTSLAGAIDWSYGCWVFTPDDAATALEAATRSAGENHDQVQYALGPDPSVDRHQLVLWMSGTGAQPSATIADPTRNFYRAAASLGYHVLAVAYRNSETINGADCHMMDACLFPSRQTVIEGVVQPGAAATLSDMLLTESIDARTVLALEYLSRSDPSGGWEQFLVPDVAPSAPPADHVRWTSVVTSGHSQGAGHAGAIGRLRTVARAAMLSGPCDASASLDGTSVLPASWTQATPDWPTDPSAVYYGLKVHSDYTIDSSTGTVNVTGDSCFAAPLDWAALGMPAAHQNENAEACGVPPTDTMHSHGASMRCPDNEPNWEAMLR